MEPTIIPTWLVPFVGRLVLDNEAMRQQIDELTAELALLRATAEPPPCAAS